MFIVLSTGKISNTQIISLVTSILSLSWGASRAFMIMRTADKADPDPELMTVALRIWPLMLVITFTDLVFLVYMAGLSGGYVFIAISVNFLTTYVVLLKSIKVPQKGDPGDRKEQVPKEEIHSLAIKNEKDAPSEDKEEPESAAIEMSLLATGPSKNVESQEEEQQAEAKTEDKEEAGGAQIPPTTPKEMPDMAAGTREDVEERQTEAKTEDNDGAKMTPPPPSSEMPGKEIESQDEEQQTGAVLEKDEKSGKEKKAEKGGEESFLFTASVCSTWIPSVVGDPEQRYFLKAGEPLQCIGLSLVSQNALLSCKISQVL